MGKLLDTLLRLQAVERDLTAVKRRLQTRKNAVAIQQKKIDQLTTEMAAIQAKSLTRRKDADRLELDLKTREAHILKLRTALNAARTNKEYAAILTEINTGKADGAKIEEEVLKIMQDVDVVKASGATIQQQLDAEAKRMAEVEQASGAEIQRLTGMMEQLSQKRAEAAAEVPPESLAIFDRMIAQHEGEAMAAIEIHGRRPPHEYVCGGCYMSLNAEHANVLRTRDEIRTCDNCKRILYMEPQTAKAGRE